MRHRLARLGLVAAIAGTGIATLGAAAPPVHAATWSLTPVGSSSAMALAQEIAGPGVEVVSATFTGGPEQGGLFAGPGVGDAIGISDGVVLSSGDIADVVGPNDSSGSGKSIGTPGDAYLDTLVAPNTTRDAAVLEIVFKPVTTDLEINYVFASEEYLEWVDSSFNDVFAFQVNGENCATVAGVTAPEPVAVNSINDHKNDQLFIDNTAGTFDTQFDGFTQVLTCAHAVNPGVNNTLRLAIADTSDRILDSAVFIESSGVTSTPKTKYTPLAQPQRAYDSRQSGTALPMAKLGAGQTVTIPMAGLYGVPADAVSVALNVTSDAAEGPGFLTVYPSTDPLPTASNVNFKGGGADPNLVVAKLGTDGAIKVYSNAATNVIVDVFGYFSTSAANGFIAVTPDRVIDTRTSGFKPGKGQIVTFQVAGKYDVPADATSVALNLTLDQPVTAGWAAAYAAGSPVPATSNVNVGPGETRPNVVFAPIGAGGAVSVYLDTSAHVIADVFGYFSPASNAELFKPVKPKRIIDTRLKGTTIPAGGTIEVKVTDIGGVPSTATAVVLNVTATDAKATGYLTVYPADVGQPPSSNVNYVAGQAIPNVVVSGVSPDGRVKIYSYAETHVIVDVAGWFG